jgi:hypothetical protein
MNDPNVPEEDVARRHLQRTSLLLANHKVYAAFGAHQDAPPFQGWVIAFDPLHSSNLTSSFVRRPVARWVASGKPETVRPPTAKATSIS